MTAQDGRALASSYLRIAAVLSLLYVLAGAAAWVALRRTAPGDSDRIMLSGASACVGLAAGLVAAWVKVLHLAHWLAGRAPGGLPGASGFAVSIAAFAGAAAAAAVHSSSALIVSLAAFAIPYAAAIIVSLRR